MTICEHAVPTTPNMRDILNLFEAIAPTGDLYHGTSVVNAALILADLTLHGDNSHGDALGISFTRSESIAWDFAGIAEERAFTFDNDDQPEGRPSLKGVVLVLDGARLRSVLGKRLKPYVWQAGDGIDDEQEERFQGNVLSIGDTLKIVKAVPGDIEWWAKTVEHMPNTYATGFGRAVATLTRSRYFRATSF